ncbi:MAG: glycosyltransferase family 39 protein [Acidimicrobiales bacterium]
MLVGLGTAVPLAISLGFGTLGIPENDDWSYRRVATELFRTHHVVFNGFAVMTLVGQAISVQPLLELTDGANWTYGVYGAMAAAIALAATYCLARRFAPTSRALLAAGLVAIAPVFAVAVPTFMTDGPGLAASMTCLAVGVAALDRAGRSRWVWLSVAMAIGVFGFSIRQFCVAAPLAVLIAGVVQVPKDWGRVLALGTLLVTACEGVSRWVSGFPNAPVDQLSISSLHAGLAVAGKLGVDLGLAVLPAGIFVLMQSGERLARLLAICPATVTLVLMVAGWLPGRLLAGDLLTQTGALDSIVLAGSRPTLFPGLAWSAIEAAAGIGVISVLAIVVARAILAGKRLYSGRTLAWLASPQGVLGVFLALSGGGLVILTAGADGWDRYIWPLVGPLGILLVMKVKSRVPGRRWSRAGVVVLSLVSLLALVSIVEAVNIDAYDAARWQAGSALTHTGIPARYVDAGFEWFGYHQPGAWHPGTVPTLDTYTWYEYLLFSGTPVCAVVSSSQMSQANLVAAGVTKYRLLGAIGPTEYLYRYINPHVAACAK